MGHRTMSVEVRDGSHVLLDVKIDRRCVVRVYMLHLGSTERVLRLRIGGGGDPVAHDPRILNCRVFSCAFEGVEGRAASQSAAPVTVGDRPAPQPSAPVAITSTEKLGLGRHAAVLWDRIQALIRKVAESGPLMTITIPVSPMARRAAAFYVGHGGLIGMLRSSLRLGAGRDRASVSRAHLEPAGTRPPERISFLHTNGCGDFTLAAREHWLDLRGYPEFDQFSMNIDSVFCYALHHGGAREELLPDPMRIYHIEHGTGSGWTPEGQAALFERLAAKGVPFVPYDDVAGWAAQMRRLNCPMIFNHENWGLAEFELPEYRPQPSSGTGLAQPGVRWAAESA